MPLRCDIDFFDFLRLVRPLGACSVVNAHEFRRQFDGLLLADIEFHGDHIIVDCTQYPPVERAQVVDIDRDGMSLVERCPNLNSGAADGDIRSTPS